MQIFIYCKVTLHISGVTAPIIRSTIKTVTAASGTGHITGTATSLQCGLIRSRWREVAVLIRFKTHGSVHRNSLLIKIQPHATVCRYLFTAKSLYMFRVSQHPSSGVLKKL